MTPSQIKLAVLVAIILGLLGSHYGIYRYGKHVEFLKQDNIRKETIINLTKKNDALKLTLQTEKTNAENALNILLSREPNRVQVPACRSNPNPSNGESQTIEANRILSEEIGRIFSEGRQRSQDIVGEAEQELIECRVSKDWADRL